MPKSFDYENAARLLKIHCGEALPQEEVVIYTICTHVSKSGMSRDLVVYIIKNNTPLRLGHGRVSGCGMDMGFHCAYTIVQKAWGRDDKGVYREVYNKILKHSWL